MKKVSMTLLVDRNDAKFAATLVAAILIVYWRKSIDWLMNGGDIKIAAGSMVVGIVSAILSATAFHGTGYEGCALIAAVFFAVIGMVLMGVIALDVMVNNK